MSEKKSPFTRGMTKGFLKARQAIKELPMFERLASKMTIDDQVRFKSQALTADETKHIAAIKNFMDPENLTKDNSIKDGLCQIFDNCIE
jgi:hypothetical protein